jgi:dCTP deaminase
VDEECESMSEFVDREIRNMIEDGELVIDPFLPENLNGASYDLTLGPWFWRRRKSEKSPDVYARDQSPRFELIDARDSGVIELGPLESVLAHSNEVVGGWRSINTQIQATSTAGRNDITVCRCAGFGDPGFVAIWCFQLQNLGLSPITLRVGTIIAQAVFRPVAVPDKIYGLDTGQYSRGVRRSAAEIRGEWNPDHMLPRAMKVRENWRSLWKDR